MVHAQPLPKHRLKTRAQTSNPLAVVVAPPIRPTREALPRRSSAYEIGPARCAVFRRRSRNLQVPMRLFLDASSHEQKVAGKAPPRHFSKQSPHIPALL